VQFPEDRQNRINKFSLFIRRTEIKSFKFSNKTDILSLVFLAGTIWRWSWSYLCTWRINFVKSTK